MADVTLILHRATEKGFIKFEAPDDPQERAEVYTVLKKCMDKNNDYVKVTIGQPRKPRSTGPESQNNHIWGHATQIANETGNEVKDVLDAAKERALKRGYPSHINPLTKKVVIAGVEDLDTEQAGMLIEELHLIAAEYNIILKEA